MSYLASQLSFKEIPPLRMSAKNGRLLILGLHSEQWIMTNYYYYYYCC